MLLITYEKINEHNWRALNCIKADVKLWCVVNTLRDHLAKIFKYLQTCKAVYAWAFSLLLIMKRKLYASIRRKGVWDRGILSSGSKEFLYLKWLCFFHFSLRCFHCVLIGCPWIWKPRSLEASAVRNDGFLEMLAPGGRLLLNIESVISYCCRE